MGSKNPFLESLRNEIKGQYTLGQVVETTEACLVLLSNIVEKEFPIDEDDKKHIANCKETLTILSLSEIIDYKEISAVESLGKAAAELMTQYRWIEMGDITDKTKIVEAISFLQLFINDVRQC